MRTTDELLTAVHKRSKEMKCEKAQRRDYILAVGSVAACLVLIVGASLAMPGLLSQVASSEYSYTGPAASVFAGSTAVGFILIGLLAFALGVCVTVLCYMLRRRRQRDKEDGSND